MFVQDNFKHDLQNVDWEYTLDILENNKKILANLGLQKVYLNQSKSKTHDTIHFAGPKLVNQNLIFITNSKNTAILS